MSFTEELREEAAAIWRAQHEHPLVRGIGDGTLDVERFKHWVRQDYLYLIEYCRLFGLVVARAPSLDLIERFAGLLQATARTEMDLHRGYAAEFGISEAELEAEVMAPTTRAYTDFLLRVAALGDFGELLAALLPCMWGFSDIGTELKARGMPEDTRYARWIEMYADPAFADLARWCRGVLDDVAMRAGPATRRRMADAFITSSRYELQFWQMAWTLERWQV